MAPRLFGVHEANTTMARNSDIKERMIGRARQIKYVKIYLSVPSLREIIFIKNYLSYLLFPNKASRAQLVSARPNAFFM